MRKVTPPYGGTEDAAEALHQAFGVKVTAEQVAQWAVERGFPRPTRVIGSRFPLLDLAKVLDWYESRTP